MRNSFEALLPPIKHSINKERIPLRGGVEVEDKEHSETVERLKRKKDYLREELDKLREYDENTYNHSLRMAELAQMITQSNEFYSLGDFSFREREDFVLATLLHDIGKVEAFDRDVIANGAPLTEEQKEMRKKHPRAGFDYVRDELGEEFAAKIVVAHHEFDGKEENKYPRSGKDRRKEAGEWNGRENRVSDEDRRTQTVEVLNVGKLARALAIIDKFEAMTAADRPYNHGGKDLETCVEELIFKNGFDSDEDRIVLGVLANDYQKKLEKLLQKKKARR